MTKEKINKLIVESNLLITTVTNGYQVWMPENIEKFAELVAKAEREACLQAIGDLIRNHRDEKDGEPEGYPDIFDAYEAIRARGNNGT